MRTRLVEVIARPLRESLDSQHRAGRCNPATVVKFSGRRHVLPVGESDWWQLYRATGYDERVYCVSINYSLSYCGVQAYDRDDQEPREELSVFLQGDEQVRESVGDIDRLTRRTIVRRLIALLEELVA